MPTHRNWLRRELLSAMLGAPLLAGCDLSLTSPAAMQHIAGHITGELVGPSHEFGHRLRTQTASVSADGARGSLDWEDVSTVIVGGGIAGLAAAWRLEREGFRDYVLVELEQVAGGTSRSDQSPVVAYPWGAHYLPKPPAKNRALVKLLEEMQVIVGADEMGEPIVAEQFLCRDPQERVFYKGRWYEGLYLHAGATADDLWQLKTFEQQIDRWIAWRDGQGQPAFAVPVAAGSNDAEVMALDKLTMADWMRQNRFTSSRLIWLVDYACRDDYGLTVEQASAWAGLFYFCSRANFVGGDPQPFITWPEGNGRIVAHLKSAVKDRVRLGQAAAEITPIRRGDRDVLEITVVDRDGAQRGIRAERVIFAAPQFVAKHVIRPYRDTPPPHFAEFGYGSWLVANLHLRGRPAERSFPLCWDSVLYDSPSLGYVAATHQACIDHGPTVLTYYYPFCDDDPAKARSRLLSMDWQDCADVVLTDLTRAHRDLPVLTQRIDVMRWGHAMIRPRPGLVSSGALASAQQPFRGIHFANTDLSGVALIEEAFYHGVRAAEEVLATHDRLKEKLL